MRKLSTVFAFLTGTALGGAVVWYITKNKYAQLAEEEIRSVKEAYAKMESKKKKAEEAMRKYQGVDEDIQDGQTPIVAAKVAEKGNIAEYAKRVQHGEPMEYSRTVVPPKSETPVDPPRADNSGELPYVIAPQEFDELDGYTPVSLYYFADGILTDNLGVMIGDALGHFGDYEEIIGDALSHFGEYEEDAVFVRNDAKRCDYEILRDERTYHDFRKTLSTNI